jgi:hypothetical protein
MGVEPHVRFLLRSMMVEPARQNSPPKIGVTVSPARRHPSLRLAIPTAEGIAVNRNPSAKHEPAIALEPSVAPKRLGMGKPSAARKPSAVRKPSASRRPSAVCAFACMAAVACLLLAPAPASADGKNAEADLRAVASYRLDDDVMNRYTAVLNNLIALKKAHPEVVEQVDASPQDTFADAIAWINRFAPYRTAITGAGMTVRDYILCSFAMIKAGASAVAVQAEGDAGWKRIPEGVAADNVRYFLAHEAKFDTVNELNDRLSGDGSEDDGSED